MHALSKAPMCSRSHDVQAYLGRAPCGSCTRTSTNLSVRRSRVSTAYAPFARNETYCDLGPRGAATKPPPPTCCGTSSSSISMSSRSPPKSGKSIAPAAADPWALRDERRGAICCRAGGIAGSRSGAAVLRSSRRRTCCSEPLFLSEPANTSPPGQPKNDLGIRRQPAPAAPPPPAPPPTCAGS